MAISLCPTDPKFRIQPQHCPHNYLSPTHYIPGATRFDDTPTDPVNILPISRPYLCFEEPCSVIKMLRKSTSVHMDSRLVCWMVNFAYVEHWSTILKIATDQMSSWHILSLFQLPRHATAPMVSSQPWWCTYLRANTPCHPVETSGRQNLRSHLSWDPTTRCTITV